MRQFVGDFCGDVIWKWLFCSTHFQFTVPHALGLSFFTRRLLAMDLNTESSTSNHYKVVLPFLVQSPWNLGTQLKLISAASGLALYSRGTDNAENISHVIATQLAHWLADCSLTTNYNIRPLRHSVHCCVCLQSTFPGNVLIKFVTMILGETVLVPNTSTPLQKALAAEAHLAEGLCMLEGQTLNKSNSQIIKRKVYFNKRNSASRSCLTVMIMHVFIVLTFYLTVYDTDTSMRSDCFV
jgi:hypothetical protein